MNILHISASYREKENHAFSYHFAETCKKLGFNITSLSPWLEGNVVDRIDDKVLDESFIEFMTGMKKLPLSRILKDYPNSDLIFIENPKFPFFNDVEIPVAYYHRDLKCQMYVPNPTHLLIRFWSFGTAHDGRPKGGQPELIELYHPEIWYNENIQKIWYCHAISEEEFGELNEFKNVERTIEGFAYRGSYKSVREMMKYNNVHYQIYAHHLDIMEYVRKHNLAGKFWEVSDGLDGYKRHLFECDATMIIPAWDSWETRRLYEASYCKCVPLLYIQNDNARRVFEEQGYKHGKTCIYFRDKHELDTLNIYDYDLDEIREEGYKMVKERHTYEARVLELLQKIDYEQILLKNDIRKVLNRLKINGELKEAIRNLEVLSDRVNK